MTRVLILSQYYHPEGPLPTSLAEGLVARGYAVEVLTAFPHHQGGHVYGGYRQRLWLKEEINGVPVIRVPLYPSHDRSALRRILTYCSFCASASILGRLLVRRPDLIYVYHPPTTSGIAALLLRALRGRIPVLYHVQDLWPEGLPASGMVRGRGMLRLLTRLSRFMYRRADRILTISPGFGAAIARHGVDPARIDVLYNWTDEAEAQPVPRDESLAERLGMTGRFNIVYAGNIGTVQDLDTVLDAARLLEEEHPLAQFLLIGAGTEEGRLRHRVEREHIPNVRFQPRCSSSEVAAIMACAQVALVPLVDDPSFDVWIPGKTQTCLAMGTPILLGIRGDAAQLVTRAEAGVCYVPSSPQSLAEAVTRLLRMPSDELAAMGRSGREYYQSHLCFDKACERVSSIIDHMIEDPRAARLSASRRRLSGMKTAKRLIDLLLSSVGSLLVLPLLLLAGLAVWLTMGHPVVFRQERAGLHGKPFTLYKLRTMREATGPNGEPLPDADRLTRLGRVLRKLSIDELPQLWNVMRGDMSLVGPRPLYVKYIARYSPEQARRLEVRPGITGWAQVNGRNALSWDERFRLDVWYVDRWSPGLDIHVLLLTLLKVLKPEGVSAAGEATMYEFFGSSDPAADTDSGSSTALSDR